MLNITHAISSYITVVLSVTQQQVCQGIQVALLHDDYNINFIILDYFN